MDKLLIRPSPFYDESLSGYISRLTTLNSYDHFSWIYIKAGLTMKNDVAIEYTDKIAPSRISLTSLSNLTDISEQ
ncbi:TniQ family protein [Fredinandcohnia quinoae]|uniref:TniQ family protein n=1 Tax=Fredinandcohnia quinoae TaxID=2918902 RepID=A0AAW5EF53_9BACI|nr:TniQ family protein [Fredinandcohnia sp. SECRCQ15]MCH1627414.1 TniQ family protein [Fredinandcohnia sp. SECRCQ15]